MSGKGASKQKNALSGCFSFVFFVFMLLIFLSIFGSVFENYYFFMFVQKVLPFIFLIIPALVFVIFAYGILHTIIKVFKGGKNSPGEKSTDIKDLINKERKTESDFEETSEDYTQENASDSKRSFFETGSTSFKDMGVAEAFKLLGLKSNVPYTKVSEKYYELVKKFNRAKMSEEMRQKVLDELAKAYEILTEYYSKNT
ncbi:MAG: Yip1 family protein [Fervidobacterium sp.]|uniref:Yip1 family protein n=1 Tax=Fervidobacterium sp. TaxID=1871331 RepID=UPI004049733F